MGRGNPNLIAWDGSKSITFSVEDALFSSTGISILMGADIAESTSGVTKVHVHKMIRVTATTDGSLAVSGTILSPAGGTQPLCETAPIFIMETEADGSITGNIIPMSGTTYTAATSTSTNGTFANTNIVEGKTYMIDCYVVRDADGVMEIQVRKDKFAGYFYVEAETLYRRQDTGADLPAIITIPKVKIQSNFSFSMSADGDPSTAQFTMDAFPDYTYFDKTKEVLCVIQVVNDNTVTTETVQTVMGHTDGHAMSYVGTDNADHPYSDSYLKAGTSETDIGTYERT